MKEKNERKKMKEERWEERRKRKTVLRVDKKK